MPRARLLRSLTLLAVAALLPTTGVALTQTYEGVLQPPPGELPVPIVVELRDVGGTLRGTVKMSAPHEGEADLDSGTNVYGHCTVTVTMSRATTLRLEGACTQKAFTGTYMLILTAKRKGVIRGDFRLQGKAPEPVKANSSGRTVTAAGTTAACLKANSQCLAGCPRGDAGVEFMCSNHCRTKLRNCKALVKKPSVGE